MATTEQTGILTYVDEDGNLHMLYPVTTMDAVDGLSEKLDEIQTATDEAKQTAENVADDMEARKFGATATIGTSWSGSTAPYTQAVTVAGILATDKPHISPVYSSTLATALAQQEAWAMVSRAVTSANTITFYCFEEAPTIAIPIQIEVNR